MAEQQTTQTSQNTSHPACRRRRDFKRLEQRRAQGAGDQVQGAREQVKGPGDQVRRAGQPV